MDKLFDFLKNNTMVVAVAAGLVLFFAMNGVMSCAAHNASGGGSGAEVTQEQKKTSGGASKNPEIKPTAAQSKVISGYDDATEKVVDKLEGAKWAATDGSGSLYIKDGKLTEKFGESDGSKKQNKGKTQTFAITSMDELSVDQTGAMSYQIFSVLDSDGDTHIMKLATVNPAALGQGGDEYLELSSDLFQGAESYTNNRSAETAKIVGLDDGNLSRAIDGRTKELKKSLIDYLVANHSTTTELDWTGNVTYSYSTGIRSFEFTLKTGESTDDGSDDQRITVSYRTDTNEFEEADIQ